MWGEKRLLDKLERRIGWFALRNLTLYIVIGNAVVWIMGYIFIQSDFVLRLVLIPQAVMRGEVWRVITFLLINTFGSSPLPAILELYFLFMIGRNLEASWGSFRITLFYFIGFALTVAVSFIFGFPVAGARYIHLTLFLAFARIAPEMRILLFFIIPVKIKWMAWAAWAFLAFEFITSDSWAHRLLILAPLTAFLLFFWREIITTIRNNRLAFSNRRAFEQKKSEARVLKATFHKCEACGLTEKDSPNMDFQYCSKCVGDHEYCSEHINDHYHQSG